MDSELRQISTLVQERRYDEARAALQPYLTQHPDSAYGWYLMSFAAETPTARKQAVKKAVQLAPDSDRYIARRAKLSASAPRSKRVPLILSGLALLGIVLVAFALFRPSDAPANTTLPTLAVVDTENTSPTPENRQVAAAVPATATIVTATPEQLPAFATMSQTEMSIATQVISEATTRAATALPVFSTGDVSLTAQSGPLLAPPAIQSTAPLPTAGALQNSTQPPPTQSLPGAPTSTPTQTPQPGVLTATPVLTGDAGVPLSTPLDIGVGSMRVVSSTRPASAFITEMGGQAADSPPGQDWVVVEAIVICSGSTNCAPNLSNLHVVGASGVAYTPAPDFSIPQMFGPGAYALGQVWGYMGFRVPTSETGLRLVLSQDDQTYTFALT